MVGMLDVWFFGWVIVARRGSHIRIRHTCLSTFWQPWRWWPPTALPSSSASRASAQHRCDVWRRNELNGVVRNVGTGTEPGAFHLPCLALLHGQIVGAHALVGVRLLLRVLRTCQIALVATCVCVCVGGERAKQIITKGKYSHYNMRASVVVWPHQRNHHTCAHGMQRMQRNPRPFGQHENQLRGTYESCCCLNSEEQVFG